MGVLAMAHVIPSKSPCIARFGILVPKKTRLGMVFGTRVRKCAVDGPFTPHIKR